MNVAINVAMNLATKVAMNLATKVAMSIVKSFAVHGTENHTEKFARTGVRNGSFVLFGLMGMLLGANPANGQLVAPLPDPFYSLRQNSVSSMEARPEAVWTGPGLNRISDLDGSIFVPENADSLFSGRGRAFSMQVSGDIVFAGLGYSTVLNGSSVQTAQGYLLTRDNGESWDFFDFPLDPVPDDPEQCGGTSVGPPCDLEVQYGGETYFRTRITVPQQSPPFEVDFRDNTFLSVNWASGLLRSSDGGESWERLLLPPGSTTTMAPGQSLQWTSQTSSGETVNRYDPRYDNNLLGFGLMIDSSDRVWVGTAGGLNISENALDAPSGEIEWRHIRASSELRGLPGNWIVTIREEPETGIVWLTTWNASQNDYDRFAMASTSDGGQTFQHYLTGERINDIGFRNGRIYVAAESGLFVSDDRGNSWIRYGEIRSANRVLGQNTSFYSVASTESAIWIGTSDGVAVSRDDGENWDILRTDMPLAGGNVYQPDAPDVNAYAYPNPFAPRLHSNVRIRFEAMGPDARIQIFDFGMNLVHSETMQLTGDPGAYEFSWDGSDPTRRLVSDGPYFYQIETGGEMIRGKILVIDG